jgi:hypothetical protein
MLRNGLTEIILELILTLRIVSIYLAEITVTKISKLMDTNPGGILQAFCYEDMDRRIHKATRKIKITTRFDTTV